MSGTERAITFLCEADRLVGVLALPATPPPNQPVGVVVVVGGPQYRVGSHRQFVDTTRQAAKAGFAALRFDVRGMGDSTGAQRSFEALTPDIKAAIDALTTQVPTVKQVVLMGLCDGASAALMYLHDTRDKRVSGLCLLNPWVRSEQSLAQAHVKHYYLQRLASPAFWRKLVSGGVGLGALAGLVSTLRKLLPSRVGEGAVAAPGAAALGRQGLGFRAAMLRGWQSFDGPIALALSGEDLTAKEFSTVAQADPDWTACFRGKKVVHWMLEGADHTLSGPGDGAQFNDRMVLWLGQLSKQPGAPSATVPGVAASPR
jgi:uncharacterized protein